MNAKQLIATVLGVASMGAATSVYAQDAAQASGATRDQVMAEFQRARAAGELSQGEWDYPKMPVAASTVTREQVTAELLRARAAGELSSNESNYPNIPASTTAVSRSQVVAELAQARKNGQIPATGADFDVARPKNTTFKQPN
ncbi:MAG TPA: hypothetical protein DCW29_12350 [Janthinobacterium sp.]|nr:hypothetical protein [Janthinobacterium sp.]